MPKIKFLLDADMPRSSAEVIMSRGFEVEDVRDIGMGVPLLSQNRQFQWFSRPCYIYPMVEKIFK